MVVERLVPLEVYRTWHVDGQGGLYEGGKAAFSTRANSPTREQSDGSAYFAEWVFEEAGWKRRGTQSEEEDEQEDDQMMRRRNNTGTPPGKGLGNERRV